MDHGIVIVTLLSISTWLLFGYSLALRIKWDSVRTQLKESHETIHELNRRLALRPRALELDEFLKDAITKGSAHVEMKYVSSDNIFNWSPKDTPQ